MPWLEAAVTTLNTTLAEAMGDMNRRTQLANYFGRDAALKDAFTELKLNPQERSLDAFGQWPRAMSQTVRAAIREALLDESVGTLTVVWTSGYDYRVHIHQSLPYRLSTSEQSLSGVVVHIETRYPFDAHPALEGTSGTS